MDHEGSYQLSLNIRDFSGRYDASPIYNRHELYVFVVESSKGKRQMSWSENSRADEFGCIDHVVCVIDKLIDWQAWSSFFPGEAGTYQAFVFHNETERKKGSPDQDDQIGDWF